MSASRRRAFLLSVAALTFLLPTPSPDAQEPSPAPIVAPSGRVTTSVAFDGRLLNGGTGWFNPSTSHSGPSRMTIDYGQPHVRGRTIFGGLVPFDEVWRLGANWATSLTLDVNMRIGDLDIPRGLYTLFLLPREDGGDLIVNRQTRQWGTDYDPSLDVGEDGAPSPVASRDGAKSGGDPGTAHSAGGRRASRWNAAGSPGETSSSPPIGASSGLRPLRGPK